MLPVRGQPGKSSGCGTFLVGGAISQGVVLWLFLLERFGIPSRGQCAPEDITATTELSAHGLAIQAAVEDGFAANVTVPIYLGDALQLRFRTGDLFAQREVTIRVEDEQNTELVFPVASWRMPKRSMP